jgi:hypothetical protein
MIRTVLAAGACALAVTGSTTTIPGRLVIRDPVHECANELLVEDPSGAPMLSANCFGTYSWGNGGLMPGGELCVTYLRKLHGKVILAKVGCVTPEGSLTLQAAGPDGPYGPKATLTAGELAGLARFAQRHGWR